MSKIKRISFLFIFLALIFSGTFAFNFPTKKLNAASSSNIVLKVQKVAFLDTNITNTDSTVKSLGQYTSQELYNNLSNINNNIISSVTNNEVVSIDKTKNEAVLISLMPIYESGNKIKLLNSSLIINGTNIHVSDYQVGTGTENRIFIMAFDFSSINTGVQEFTNLSGKYELKFAYNYDYTNSNGSIETGYEEQSFDFYLIDDNNYFTTENLPNIPEITNNDDKVIDSLNKNKITYYYNYQNSQNTPKITYNPKKYQPTINFNYNETNVILTTTLNETYDKVLVTSDDEQIIASKTLDIVDDKVTIELDRLGQYQIEYNLVVDNTITVEVISNSQTQNLIDFPSHTLNIYGFEAYYTHYDINDSKVNFYKQFHNSNFLSDFTYLLPQLNNKVEELNNDSDETNNVTNALQVISNFYESLTDENKEIFKNSIATTNQAPVKLDAYITELNNASFVKLDENFEKIGTVKVFSTSKRFGSDENETGIFAVLLNYEFGTYKTNQTQLIIFKIENSTPVLKFDGIDENDEIYELPANNFTNKNVKVSWDGIKVNPFSVTPEISFTKNGTNLSNLDIVNSGNENYTIFNAGVDDGEYLVTIKYGINHSTSVTKTFTIDNEQINFNLYNVDKKLDENDNYNYIISNQLSNIAREDGVKEYRTNSPFSIFALNKLVKNNNIRVNYEYMPINEDNGNIDYKFDANNKLYIYNNKVLNNLYIDLDYTNKKLNNLENFDEINNYNFSSNNIAVISNTGLYKFEITDYAGNTQTFFVLLDNTDPIVLHTNDKYSNDKDYDISLDGSQNSLEDWLKSRQTLEDLQIKKEGRNLVSNDYSLIVGNGKFIKFNFVETINGTDEEKEKYEKASNLAEEYFGIIVNEQTQILQNIYQDYNSFNFVKTNGNIPENVIEINENNIVFIASPTSEVKANFKATFTLNNKEYFREFNLNTDKNQILIYGYNDTNGYYNIDTFENENITNSKFLYVRFLDDYEDNFKLASLTLDFYPFIEKDSKIEFGTSRSIDLLSLKETCNIPANENNGVLTGGFITSLINPTFLNGEYVTSQGKYVLTKTYVGFASDPTTYPQISQTFFVDRISPIERFSQTLLIGSDIHFKLNDATLSAENILYFIQNNQPVVTNKLPITSSINTNNKKYENAELNSFIVYYEIFKGSLSDNVCLYSSNALSPYYNAEGYKFTNTGSYTFKIFDNSGYEFNNERNINPNFISFEINITNDSPNGYFIVDDNEEIVETISSTNSNSLSFVFTDSTSDYLYDIDIYNILLTRNGTNILKTFKDQNANNTRFSFNLNGTFVYYESSLGGIFKLERTTLSSTKLPNNRTRYSYKLTIINPDINSTLVANGKSLEAEYKLSISYFANDAVLGGKNYAQKEYIIYIDHTSPYSNVNRYIDSDEFLTSEEKALLKQSVANKDRTPEINFENYTFLITEAPKTYMEGLSSLDTSSIYIRKYNKYEDNEISDYQSIVFGDSEFDKQITTRYKFDVNALDSNGNSIYSSSSYDIEDLNSFFASSGFYEIIEIDNAQNYTVYSVYYNPNYEFSVDYSFDKDNSENNAGHEEIKEITTDSIANGLNFELKNININEKDYLSVNLSINGNISNLRYLPFEMQSNIYYTYFTSLSEMIEYINNAISSDSQLNTLGSQYIIELTNRNGTKITITNNTPNEQIDLTIVDYSNYFTVTLPNNDKATYVTKFNVYPVISGKVSSNKLDTDSDGKTINSIPNSSFRFTNTVKIDGIDQTISIYYLEWTDNFNRTQYKVKTIGIQDVKYVDYADFITQEVNGIEYTINENAKLVYAKNLYSVEIYYSLLPDLSTHKLILESDNLDLQTKISSFIVNNKNLEEINLLQILKVINGNQTLDNIVQFTIYLTDLSTLEFKDFGEKTIYTFSYVYYPKMPEIDFTDSASNNLNIYPITNENTTTISTSKNVTLSYINNTLFNINIIATRNYTNELGQEIIENIENIGTEYTFSKLGTYTIKIVNTLGKENIYQFSIKTASNKTYSVLTIESSMENFEVFASPVKIPYNIDGEDVSCETYYSIYKTTVEVNTDFNLYAENIQIDDNTTIYKIIKKDTNTVYKYIATIKVDYNSNFLKTNDELGADLKIFKGIDETENLADNLNGFSLKIPDNKLKISLPLFNNFEGNLINVKMYFNNELIELNKNIYSSDETTQTIILSKVPAGVYNFYFEDIAGNTQLFNGNAFLSVFMLTEVITTINGENPIDYQIYNSSVNLKIEQEKQYNTRSIEIIGYKNGTQISKFTRNSSGEYVFTEYGLYTIEIKASITIDGKEQPIYKTIHFTILNENEAFKEFSYIGLNGQTVSKVLRDGVDITNEIKKFLFEGNSSTPINKFENALLYNLNLASNMKFSKVDEITEEIITDTYNGAGHYQIFVENQNSLLEAQSFNFNVWIREQNVKILLNSSLKEGGSTTKAIKFTYNPYLIYTQIGECAIYLNDNAIIEINGESENKVNTYTIPRETKGTFIVQVKTNSGNTELSFIVNKKEPLSTVTIIVIVISSVIVALGIFLFIKLRTRMKVK